MCKNLEVPSVFGEWLTTALNCNTEKAGALISSSIPLKASPERVPSALLCCCNWKGRHLVLILGLHLDRESQCAGNLYNYKFQRRNVYAPEVRGEDFQYIFDTS